MTFSDEPQHDQAVQQHRHRRGALVRRGASSLAVLQSPAIACCRGRRLRCSTATRTKSAPRRRWLDARRVERLPRSSAEQAARQPRYATADRRRRMHIRPSHRTSALDRVGRRCSGRRAGSVAASIASGVGNSVPRLRGRPLVPGIRARWPVVQPRIHEQAAGQIAVGRQLAEHALPTVGDCRP